MEQKITKWGNSLAVRLPKSFCDDLAISEGNTVDIQKSDDNTTIIIKVKKKRKTIKELFKGYDGPKLEEVDFGKPEGREVWLFMHRLPKQGDIIKVNFNPTKGHEQRGFRNALVVSNYDYNKYTQFAILCPITNSVGDYPLNVNLESRTQTTGAILCSQIRAVDHTARSWSYVEKLPADLLENVKDIIFAEIE